MDLVFDMYGIDFATFGYSRVIPGRSDLVDPLLKKNIESKADSSSEDLKAGLKTHSPDEDLDSTGTSTDDGNSGKGIVTPKGEDAWSTEGGDDEQDSSLIYD